MKLREPLEKQLTVHQGLRQLLGASAVAGVARRGGSRVADALGTSVASGKQEASRDLSSSPNPKHFLHIHRNSWGPIVFLFGGQDRASEKDTVNHNV